jgi:hypothetical protein
VGELGGCETAALNQFFSNKMTFSGNGPKMKVA